MFRKMRRFKQMLPEEEIVAVLERGQTGIMACLGDDGYPYMVPVNYIYTDGKIYFHGAKTGHKMDAIAGCDKVSFCVIDRDDVVPEENATYYRSVIAFGRARVLTEEAEIRYRAKQVGMKFTASEASVDEEIETLFNALAVVEITIEHMTGKEGKALAQARRDGRLDIL